MINDRRAGRAKTAIVGGRTNALIGPLKTIVPRWFAMIGVATLAMASPAAAGTYSVLYQFGPAATGSYEPLSIVGLPSGSVVGMAQAYRGNVFFNVIYKLDPPADGQGAWQYSEIYDSRSYPVAGQLFGPSLLVDAKGNLYGNTEVGENRLGSGQSGTVFRLSLPVSGSGPWNCTVLFKDYYQNATNMLPRLLTYLDPTAQRLYGLGFYYQPIGLGGKPVGLKIFRLDLPNPAASSSASSLTTISPPVGLNDTTAVTLAFSREGAFYGTSYNSYRKNPLSVFRLTPPAADTGERQLQTLATSLPNGDISYTSVTVDLADQITGVGVGYPPADYGEIWRLSPPSTANGAWQSNVLYRFKGPSAQDGSTPVQIVNQGGVYYGITYDGGRSHDGKLARQGTLFELSTPPTGGAAQAWRETILHTFGGAEDGSIPQALTSVPNAQGTYSLYGVTNGGGINDDGTVFRYVP